MSSTFGVEFENRTGAIITVQSDIAFRPLRWKAAASGGPVESEIQVTGTRAGLKSLRGEALSMAHEVANQKDEK
jgi:hypothetical protein